MYKFIISTIDNFKSNLKIIFLGGICVLLFLMSGCGNNYLTLRTMSDEISCDQSFKKEKKADGSQSLESNQK